MDKQKHESFLSAIAQIRQSYGDGAIMKLGDRPKVSEVGSISTGSLSLDLALGGFGFPAGRIIEVYGHDGSGKTSLCLSAVAAAQRRGPAAFIDAEHALDPAYATKLGVDIESLFLSQPDTMEQALDMTEILVRSNDCAMIVVDSVAALVPKAELEGDIGQPHMALQARLMSKAIRKLTGAISRSKSTVVFINQLRDQIGTMMGHVQTTTCGWSLKFYSSVRLEVKRLATVLKNESPIGTRVQAKVIKNKVAPPFQKTEFDLLFEDGISLPGDLLDLGQRFGLLEKQGAALAFKGTAMGTNREFARQFLKANPNVALALESEIRLKAGCSIPSNGKLAA